MNTTPREDKARRAAARRERAARKRLCVWLGGVKDGEGGYFFPYPPPEVVLLAFHQLEHGDPRWDFLR